MDLYFATWRLGVRLFLGVMSLLLLARASRWGNLNLLLEFLFFSGR